MMSEEASKLQTRTTSPPIAEALASDDLMINISSVEVQQSFPGKIALYKVVTSDNRTHKTAILLKRYHAFVELDKSIYETYASSHLMGKNFPRLANFAPKKFKLTTNHFSKDFLLERRYALTEYLNCMSEFPGLGSD